MMKKKELTSIEIRFLVKELQEIVDGKIDQVYQPTKNEIIIQLHIPNAGKKLLKILLPSFIYTTSKKYDMPKKISAFITFLREKISNGRIREIKQIENERIIEIRIEKDKKYSLLIELFGKGNIILCQQEIILTALSIQKWKDREIQRGQKYISPASKYNLFGRESLAEAIHDSEETISKTLAVKLRMGKIYAEEICLAAEIDKLNKKISRTETEKIYSEVQRLVNRPLQPMIVYNGQEVLDIVPIKLKVYFKKELKEYKTYNDALATILDKQTETSQKTQAMQKFTQKLERIETKIHKQKETLVKLETEAEESQRKGELIYEHYQEIQGKLAKTGRHQKIRVDF